ncbi:hypothetical protein [Parvularcula lutaonensis]|uniref:Replication protein-C C-terminal domain-containing protein n=1 Tax=Parvularcula lutaonensis TaxID=491923 RepID=A0ABV7M8R6_9PROT|nr:hypothetical protein [Parvularcula lutaonensis]GGY56478.1 hypothetical protein GCM10007148_27560 [Parvularcula lutaonensis]
MTGQMCLKPGLARRHDRYEDEVLRCQTERASLDLNRLMIDKALALGTAEVLTAQERCLMMALCAHLDIQGIAAGETSVWPGSARLCRLLGLGESTLRRLKGSLEEKGFLLRRYDRRNRPLKGGAIDLKPFLLKVPELCRAVGHTEAEIRRSRENSASERYDHRSEEGAHPLAIERATGNTKIQTSERPLRQKDREGEGIEPVRPDEESAMIERAEAIMPGISADPSKAAAEALGEKKGRRLWSWAHRRHGPDAILALAIASKSAKIKDPEAWFAWYATNAAEVDLEGLAARVTKAPQKAAPPSDPLLARFAEAFAETAGEGAALSYLSNAAIAARGKLLVIRTASRIAMDRLASAHMDNLQRAAALMGFAEVQLNPKALPPNETARPKETASMPGSQTSAGMQTSTARR